MLDRSPRPRDGRPAPDAAPARFNIGTAVLDRWAALDPDRPAVIDLQGPRPAIDSFGALKRRSDRLALALRRLGVAPGDRVAVFLPQGAAALVAQAIAALPEAHRRLREHALNLAQRIGETLGDQAAAGRGGRDQRAHLRPACS